MRWDCANLMQNGPPPWGKTDGRRAIRFTRGDSQLMQTLAGGRHWKTLPSNETRTRRRIWSPPRPPQVSQGRVGWLSYHNRNISSQPLTWGTQPDDTARVISSNERTCRERSSIGCTSPCFDSDSDAVDGFAEMLRQSLPPLRGAPG